MVNDDEFKRVRKQPVSIKKGKIIYCGGSGFPFGSATVQRQIQLAKTLQEAGFKVLVLINRGEYSKTVTKRENITFRGENDGIKYYYTSFCAYRPENIVVRNFLKIFGKVNEILFIAYFTLFQRAGYLLYRAHRISNSKFYYHIAKAFNLEVIYDYVEYYDSLKKRDSEFIDLPKKESFDFNFFKYTDKVIVINNFLENHVRENSTGLKVLKIPPIIDFEKFDKIKPYKGDSPYFLYCGSIVYMDIVKFIINSYHEAGIFKTRYKLKLVISGNNNELEKLKMLINKHELSKNIEVLSKLSYENLLQYYAGATALLIPLSQNFQDKARFPFKICEYVASKRPILTTSIGVINDYFEDGENAFIAEPDSVSDYARKLHFISEHQDLSDQVGRNGHKLGLKYFNYKNYVRQMESFLLNS